MHWYRLLSKQNEHCTSLGFKFCYDLKKRNIEEEIHVFIPCFMHMYISGCQTF